MKQSQKIDILDIMCDCAVLSLDAPNFEIALAALKLQTAITEYVKESAKNDMTRFVKPLDI